MNDKKIEKLLNQLREESKIIGRLKESYMKDKNDYKAGYMRGKQLEIDTFIRLLTDDDFFDEYVGR